MIAAPTTIPGFIIGNENDPYYDRKRTFLQNSKVKQYLQKKYPETITESQRTYTLREILKLIESTVEKENLYHRDNPELIIGDEEFETAFGPRLMMTTDVHHLVSRQMKTNINRRENGPDLGDPNKIQPRYLPKWATEQATAIKSAREADISTIIDEDLKVSKKLSELMNEQNNYKEPREIFNLSEILDTLLRCLRNKNMAQKETMNTLAVTITDRTLQDALGVTALDVRQLVSLAQHQTERKPCRRPKSAVKEVLKLINLQDMTTLKVTPTQKRTQEPL